MMRKRYEKIAMGFRSLRPLKPDRVQAICAIAPGIRIGAFIVMLQRPGASCFAMRRFVLQSM